MMNKFVFILGTCMGLEATKTIHRIIIHKDEPNTVYVAATGSAWGAPAKKEVFSKPQMVEKHGRKYSSLTI